MHVAFFLGIVYIFYMKDIEIHPDICNGQPVIRGTRITAQSVLDFLAAGDTIEEVLDAYPTLSREQVLACISFSSDLLRHQYITEKVA
jgi:uncharacterized protein (DUF433 family)